MRAYVWLWSPMNGLAADEVPLCWCLYPPLWGVFIGLGLLTPPPPPPKTTPPFPQEISNSVWGAARLAHYEPAVMDAVAEHIVSGTAAVAATAVAGSAGVIGGGCGGRLAALLPQHVANVAWAYGRLTHAHRPLFDGLVARTVQFCGSHSYSRGGGRGGGDGKAATAATAVAGHGSSTHSAGQGAAGGSGGSGGSSGGSSRAALTMQHLANVCCAVGVFGWRYPDLIAAAEERLEQCAVAARLLPAAAPAPAREMALLVMEGGSGGDGRGGQQLLAAATAEKAAATAKEAETVDGDRESGELQEALAVAGEAAGGQLAVAAAAAAAPGSSSSLLDAPGQPPPAQQPPQLQPPQLQPPQLQPHLAITAQQACNLAWGLSLVAGCSRRSWQLLLQLLEGAVEGQGGLEEMPAEALTQIYQVGTCGTDGAMFGFGSGGIVGANRA